MSSIAATLPAVPTGASFSGVTVMTAVFAVLVPPSPSVQTMDMVRVLLGASEVFRYARAWISSSTMVGVAVFLKVTVRLAPLVPPARVPMLVPLWRTSVPATVMLPLLAIDNWSCALPPADQLTVKTPVSRLALSVSPKVTELSMICGVVLTVFSAKVTGSRPVRVGA